jgi:hypothetical protein
MADVRAGVRVSSKVRVSALGMGVVNVPLVVCTNEIVAQGRERFNPPRRSDEYGHFATSLRVEAKPALESPHAFWLRAPNKTSDRICTPFRVLEVIPS